VLSAVSCFVAPPQLPPAARSLLLAGESRGYSRRRSGQSDQSPQCFCWHVHFIRGELFCDRNSSTLALVGVANSALDGGTGRLRTAWNWLGAQARFCSGRWWPRPSRPELRTSGRAPGLDRPLDHEGLSNRLDAGCYFRARAGLRNLTPPLDALKRSSKLSAIRGEGEGVIGGFRPQRWFSAGASIRNRLSPDYALRF